MQADLAECFPGPLRVSFFNDIDVKVVVDLLIYDFRIDSVVFFFSPSLSNCGRVSLRSIHYIPDFFFFKYGLSKVGPLRPIFEVIELLSLFLTIVILVSHLADLDNLGKGKKGNICCWYIHRIL